MRIALVTEFYFPHLGGVTEHVENLAVQFRARGHEVTIVTANMDGQGDDPPEVVRLGTSRVVFKNGSFARVTTGLRLREKLRAVLRERRIDLVHLHGALAPTLGLVGQDAADECGIPVVATYHSWFPRSIGYRTFRAPLQRRLDRIAASIAVSQPVIDAMSRYFTTGDWQIIPNGIDIEHFHPVAHDDAPPHMLFLGRLDPRNGLGTMLDAMPRIRAQRPDARLVVAGDGPLRQYYEKRARPLGDSVRFLGQVNGERPRLYGTAGVYVCPTSKASFGITLLEAMACGTPIIGSDITGFRELVDHGAEAMLAPVDDARVWADTAVALLDDPARRQRMGAAGRAKATRFAWPDVAARVFAVYEKVLA